MALAKFTIEMAADLGQLKRDLAATQAVVNKMGAEVAAGYAPIEVAQRRVGAAAKQAANDVQMGHLAQQKSARLVQQQNIQLAAQLQDFAVQVAGGQNPFLSLAQQGSQLHAVYGGLRPAMAAITGLITAKTVAVTGLAAGLGVLAIGYVQGSNQSAEFRRSLALTGGAAGLTAGSFESMIDRIADATGKGTGYVRDMAQALVSTGRFGPAQIEEATRGATLMAAITGQTAAEVAKEWARMSESPASYAREANKSLNFLTDKELQYIQQLEKNGKRAEAAQLLTKQMMGVYTKDVAQDLGLLQRAAAATGAAFSTMWDQLLGIGRPVTLEDQMATLQEGLERQQRRGIMPGDETQARSIALLKEKLEGLSETRRLLQRGADAKADRARDERAKTEARELAEKTKGERERAASEAAAAAKRMQAAKDALAAAQAEASAKLQTLSVDQQLAMLQQRRALGVDTTADQKRMTSEAIAQLELQKIDAQAVALASDLARARRDANSATAEGLQAQAQVVQLQSQQLELQAQRGQVTRQLATDVNQINAAEAQDAQRWADKLASVREVSAGYRQQLELQGMSELAAERLTEVRKIETAYQRELLDLQRNLALTEEERATRAAALAAERDAQLNAYADLHARRYREVYDAETGVNSAIQEYLDRVQQSGRLAKEATANVLTSLEGGLVRLFTKGKAGAKEMADTIISEFLRIRVAQPFLQALAQALPGMTGTMSGTSATGSGTMSELASLGVFAKGGAFAGGVQAFAKGGVFTNTVVSQPTLFSHGGGIGVMGEAYDEAVMPLKRDSQGRLGVIANLVANGNGGGTPNVQVNVINQGGGLEVTQQRTTRGADGALSVDVMVRQVQDMLADNVAAGAGSLYHAMGNRFVKAGVS